jgi:hypothetical protein
VAGFLAVAAVLCPRVHRARKSRNSSHGGVELPAPLGDNAASHANGPEPESKAKAKGRHLSRYAQLGEADESERAIEAETATPAEDEKRYTGRLSASLD